MAASPVNPAGKLVTSRDLNLGCTLYDLAHVYLPDNQLRM